ncbi:MAG: Ig domain-containing protein [Tannerella sp.]|nr:Ig domain-containing protein [Tannerella sp.]
MKKDLTRRNHCPDAGAVKMKVARTGFTLFVAALLCAAFLAPGPLNAQNEVGNAGQAVDNWLYFGNFPQKYEGWNINVETAMAAVPHVKKIHYRAQAPNTWDGRDSFYVGFFSVKPIQWRVLANDAEGILLLSEHNLTQWAYHTPGGPVTWQGSSIRDSLENRFLQGSTSLGGGKNYFSPVEIAAVASSTLQNPKIGRDVDGITTTDNVFLLSYADSSLFGSNAADRMATNTQYTASFRPSSDSVKVDSWLLRTHSVSLHAGLVMRVSEHGGYIDRTGVSNGSPAIVRPALRLSRDKFIMLSSHPKPALGTAGVPLTGVFSDIMKLTLVDNLTLDLTVGGATDYATVTSGDDLTGLTYTVSSGGSDDYISVLVEEQGGNAVYYRKLTAVSSAGNNITLPPIPFNSAGLTSGAYTVKIFHERVNASASEPDLASEPTVISVGIAVSALAPTIITTYNTDDDLSNGWTDIPYNDTIRFAGDPDPVLSVIYGALPTGLVLEATGILHGTPTVASTYNFTIKALNGEGQDTKTYEVVIGASAAPVITGPAPGLIDSVVRNVFTYVDTVEATGGPAPIYTLSSGKLPEDLKLDTVTGIISGTAKTEGTLTFTVMASNPLGNDFREYSIKVKIANNPIAPSFVTTALPRALAGQSYSFQIEANGEPFPKFLAKSPLPSGLSLDPMTGIISGEPAATSPVLSPYPVTISLESAAGVQPSTFLLYVDYTLDPPHLTLTSSGLTTGSTGTDPFNVTATFGVPVSDLQLSDIDVTGGTGTGTLSNLVPVSPTNIGGTDFATVWTFDVTPDPSQANGSVIEAYIKAGAAQDTHTPSASTSAHSDTVRVSYQFDQPAIVYLLPLIGKTYVTNPGSFYFDVTPNGTGAGANDLYVDNAPANSTSIRNAIEIRRNGALFEDWTVGISNTVSGARITINGAFIRGDYEVVVKPGRVGNNAGKFTAQFAFQFSVQLSTSWYEGCEHAFTLTDYPASPASRRLAVSYTGLTDYLTAPDGGSPASAVNLPAGQTEAAFAFRVLAVPEAQEGDSVAIIIADPHPVTPSTTTYWIKLYNRPRAEDVVYIPATTRYPGYFRLIRSGSPALRRSFDAGQHWSSAWAPATDLELADAGGEIILSEPDGCDELTLPLDVSISPTVRRLISLAAAANIVTSPGGSEYSIFSGADFEFQVTMTGPLADRKPLVTTDRQYVPDSVGVIVEANDDGTFTVRLRAVREPVHVALQAGDLLTGNEAVEATRVWASGGQLYITSMTDDRAEVYTLAGVLLKSVDVAAGQTVRTDLPPGVFVVRLGSGQSFKVGGF